jgi:hypothetical protein
LADEERHLHPIVMLSKYFTWASYMKGKFDKVVVKVTDNTAWNDPVSIEMFMFMSHWYATLYVVIEGWRDLGLHDPVVDDLLKSPNVDFLRLYRNGVSHFQRHYFDQRYMPFLKNPGSVQWVRSLHEAFFKYLNAWFAAHGLDGSPNT